MRILLATDFSRDAETAQKLVMGMPLPAGSRIRVLHAIEPLGTVVAFGTAPMVDISDTTTEEARTELQKVERSLRRSCCEVDYTTRIGRAADVIVDECTRFSPDIIVIGNRGRGALATTILGSVSAEVIDRAPVPVLVARRTTLLSAVLAEDGSASAAAGASFVAAYAPFANTAVHVVSVVDVPYPVVLADPTGARTALAAYQDYRSSMEEARRRLDASLTTRLLALREVGITTTGERREGDTAFEIVEAAKERKADCIVIGSRGLTGLRRFVLGSVTRRVLYHAPCSVLIAHAPAGVESADVNGRREVAGIQRKEV